MPKVVVIVQARMGSTRLPGKVMKLLCGIPVLEHDLRRIQAAQRVDEILVATTDKSHDQQVAELALRCGAKAFRGSEDNVLSRYYHAACQAQADIIVRITSDCPLIDPWLLDQMLERFLSAQASDKPYDYFSNTLKRRSYPTGLDTEIFTFDALKQAYKEADLAHQLEHVTPFFYQQPQRFRLGGIESEVDHGQYRWTLDTQEDLTLIDAIYRELYREGELFRTEQVLALMQRRPELPQLNAHIQPKPLEQSV